MYRREQDHNSKITAPGQSQPYAWLETDNLALLHFEANRKE